MESIFTFPGNTNLFVSLPASSLTNVNPNQPLMPSARYPVPNHWKAEGPVPEPEQARVWQGSSQSVWRNVLSSREETYKHYLGEGEVRKGEGEGGHHGAGQGECSFNIVHKLAKILNVRHKPTVVFRRERRRKAGGAISRQLSSLLLELSRRERSTVMVEDAWVLTRVSTYPPHITPPPRQD